MAVHSKIALWMATALVAFLGGYIPQYQQANALRDDLRVAQEQIRALEWQIKLAEFRDLAGMVYLTTNQQNYGNARQHSTQFFDRASELSREASDPGLRNFLESTAQQRDAVTAGLARGEGSIRETVERLYLQTQENTKQ